MSIKKNYNMRCILLSIIFISLLNIGISQELPVKDGSIVYEYVFTNNNASRDELFTSSMKFFAETFNNSNYAVKLQDKEQGKIIGKGFKKVDLFKNGSIIGTSYPFHFTIEVDVKENRARIKIYDIYTEYTSARYGVIRSETLEQLNEKASKGIDKKAKKLKTYQSWSDAINSNFLAIVVLYKRSVENSTNDNDW